MNHYDKHKDDYYVNPHVIRAMINMIAKQMVRTQNNSPFKHGCLKMLNMYVKDLINIALT